LGAKVIELPRFFWAGEIVPEWLERLDVHGGWCVLRFNWPCVAYRNDDGWTIRPVVYLGSALLRLEGHTERVTITGAPTTLMARAWPW
jgi:hypothetical protein